MNDNQANFTNDDAADLESVARWEAEQEEIEANRFACLPEN